MEESLNENIENQNLASNETENKVSQKETPKPKEKKKRTFKQRFKRFMWKSIFVLLLLFTLGILGFHFIGGITDEELETKGYISQVSKQGVLFKTYEAEIIQGVSTNNVESLPFNFVNSNKKALSVENDSIYKELLSLQGEIVNIKYEKTLWHIPWKGNTPFLITDVELVVKNF